MMEVWSSDTLPGVDVGSPHRDKGGWPRERFFKCAENVGVSQIRSLERQLGNDW